MHDSGAQPALRWYQSPSACPNSWQATLSVYGPAGFDTNAEGVLYWRSRVSINGISDGTSNTAVVGERRFTATPAQVVSFFGRLLPYLPVGEVLLTGKPIAIHCAKPMSMP